MDNYPPGFDPKSLENPYGDLAEHIRDQADIRINISVEVNGDVVYEDWFHSTDSLEESGLRKADSAIESELTKLTDSAWDDANEPREED